MTLSVVILTRDSEATIGATLASAARVSDDIHVVDSGSSDSTLEIVTNDRKLSAQFEHTVAVTRTGVDVLTLRRDETPMLERRA